MRSPRCPKAGASLLVDVLGLDMACCGAVMIPRLVSTCWWVRQGPGVNCSPLVGGYGSGSGFCRVSVDLFVGGVGVQMFPGSGLALWWMEADLRVSC